MNNHSYPLSPATSFLMTQFRLRLPRITSWLSLYEKQSELPLYSSVDIRDAGFKTAVVDTNIFPAGFNNLCDHGLHDAALFFKLAIQNRAPCARSILIITEEHTRNLWYLENIRILRGIIERAGFQVTVATFLSVQPAFCETEPSTEMITASGLPLQVFCLKNLLKRFEQGDFPIDMVILNNDLSGGIPDLLKKSPIPIYPSIQAGWHSRLKSRHFYHTNILMKDMAEILSIDPWLLTALYAPVPYADINASGDRTALQDQASDLLKNIRMKYAEHHIPEKPYLIIKSDYGTYGMGVLAVEDPSEISSLSRAKRSKLTSGKGSRQNTRYLIQEGIPTIYQENGEVSEACLYQVENHLIGGFFRSHTEKGARENLNSKGMRFKKMCPHDPFLTECRCAGPTAPSPFTVFDVYRILARIAALAACREITDLQETAV